MGRKSYSIQIQKEATSLVSMDQYNNQEVSGKKALIASWVETLRKITGCSTTTARKHVRSALKSKRLHSPQPVFTGKFKLGDRVLSKITKLSGVVVAVVPSMKVANTNIACYPYRVKYDDWIIIYDSEDVLEKE